MVVANPIGSGDEDERSSDATLHAALTFGSLGGPRLT
jgi:hypothetical protein